MSNSMDILAREVVAYHFCQMDNEPSCLIPHFIHSISAQMSQTPNLVAYRRLIASDEKLKARLSMQSCLDDPKQSFVKGNFLNSSTSKLFKSTNFDNLSN